MTRTLLFLLLTRRRLPISACWARRSFEMGGLSGFLRTSCAALEDGLQGWAVEEEEGSWVEALGASLMLGRRRGLPL